MTVNVVNAAPAVWFTRTAVAGNANPTAQFVVSAVASEWFSHVLGAPVEVGSEVHWIV